MESIEGEPGLRAGRSRPYASFGRRLAAWTVDILLILLATTVLDAAGSRLVPGLWETGPDVLTAGIVAVTVLELGYLVWFTSRGATIGKLMLGLRVIGPDGRPPGIARAARRYLLQLGTSLALLAGDATSRGGASEGEWNPTGTFILLAVVTVILVDHLSMLRHPEGRTVHDRIGDTWVVNASRR